MKENIHVNRSQEKAGVAYQLHKEQTSKQGKVSGLKRALNNDKGISYQEDIILHVNEPNDGQAV